MAAFACEPIACFHPLRAFRARSGEISIGKELGDSLPLSLPCGGCLGCRMATAKAWALRCQLELQNHQNAVFSTLTYSDENVPLTLTKRDFVLFTKRARKALSRGHRLKFPKAGKARGHGQRHGQRPPPAQPLRFFGCGEYGETTGRPHFHAILFGPSIADADSIDKAWGKGHTRIDPVTPQRIAYVAGYVQKKIGWRIDATKDLVDENGNTIDMVDPETGEYLGKMKWQPPFIQMSRNPGIGGQARKFINSWRLYAVHDGWKMPVPRYLHDAWKAQATNTEMEELLYEKSELGKLKEIVTKNQLNAAEIIAKHRQENAGKKRRY